jgi:sulfide:quinone oxidoreductase
MSSSTKRFSVVIVGGGAAGVTVASILRRQAPHITVALIDPSRTHDYQPAWTLVGAGEFDVAATRRPMQSVLASGVTWLCERVASFEPATNSLTLAQGDVIGYEQLVVAAGLQTNWSQIEGLTDTLGRNGVCSNYSFDTAPYTWKCIQGLQAGRALFTQPPMPIKCPGAPQKILYMAADIFKRQNRTVEMGFFNAGPAIFGVPFYARALEKVVAHYAIKANYGHTLVAVNGPAKEAVFETTVDGVKTRRTEKFDMLHVTPPQSAPDFIKASPFADAGGFVAVNKHSLQSTHFPNVFALGDCAGTPNSKTAAAVRAQAPLVVENLLALRANQPLTAHYDGYASCPLTTSVGKIILAEFGYDGVIMPSFSADPRQPMRRHWHLKKHFLPWLYWNVMLKGNTKPDWHAKRDYPEQLPAIAP